MSDRDASHAKGVQEHHHYDHYTPEMARRLDQFYGRVDTRLNELVAQSVAGESVLDVGCGFGSLTEHLRVRGFKATGIDLLAEGIAEGKKRYPLADLRVAASEELDFPEASFDTVVLKDTIHHIYEEDDVAAFLNSVRRIARRRVVVLDPNPTFILLLSRKLIGHVDPVCSPSDAARVMSQAGFKVVGVSYSELFAFPMSGGYVGPALLPARPRLLGSLALALDAALFKLLEAAKLGRFCGWRYLLVADVENSPE
jgi:SAM-dependent methyltransferase